MRRTSNQDSLAVAVADDAGQWAARGHLFVVADGMGAHAAGELASRIAVDNIPHAYQKRMDLPPCQSIVEAVQDANRRIHEKGENSVDFHGMGTTCSCLLLLPDGALAAHVGDSRIYRLRDGALEQLTFDHSLVWELGAAGQAPEDEAPPYVPRNVITRSLGPHPEVKVDLEGPHEIRTGDRYLLCSDGLTGPLQVELIGLVVGALPAEDAAQTLADLANLLGGPDNVTVIVVEVDGSPPAAGGAAAQRTPDTPTPKPAMSWSTVSMFDRAMLAVAACGCLWAAFFSIRGPTSWAWPSGAMAAAAALAFLLRKIWFPNPPFEEARVRGRHGKGPYRRREITASTESIETLSDIVRQLEDLEGQRKWSFDWSKIHESRAAAHQAIADGDIQAAVVAYSQAVRLLMKALRENGPRPSSDSTINLGEE